MKKSARGVSKQEVLQALRYRGIYVERVMSKTGARVWKASDGFECESMHELASHYKVETK